MKIGINALSARFGGGVSVSSDLLPRLAKVDQRNSYVIFYSLRQQAVAGATPASFKKVVVRHLPRNPYVRVLWEQLVFPFYLVWYRIDVLYSVGNTTSILAPCKIVLLIENANPYSRIGTQWLIKERFRNKLLRILGLLSARKATQIRFVSKNSCNLIVPQLGIDPKKCVVIPHGIALDAFGSLASVATEANSSSLGHSSYILTIGVNGPHRNTARLLRAFSVLVNQYGYKGDLVVVGNTGSRAWRATLDNLVQEPGIGGRVVFKGEVPHNDIGLYFRHADAFVFPSVEETFGIPLLEAMKYGVPVVASDTERDVQHRGICFNPFREICDNAAHYFNPFHEEDIARALHTVVTDKERRIKLTERGHERVKKYNVEDTAFALVQLFENVYND